MARRPLAFRRGLRLLATGAAVALLAGCRGGPERPRNVVLLSIDTLNASALQVYDAHAAALSNLDGFAAGARVFTAALSTASWTLPAHASLFTGLYPDRHGATDPRRTVVSGVAPLVERLRRAGMETVAFTDRGFLEPGFGYAGGFYRFDQSTSPGGPHPHLTLPRAGAPDPVHGRALFDRALAYLAQRKPGDPPFFLFLHTYAVHDYFQLHRWATALLHGGPLLAADDYQRCLEGSRVCSARDWQMLRELYAAELANVDAGFGRLLQALAKQGLAESTQVIVLSDHGEGFDVEHHRINHGGRLHADLVRVPLLWSGPGVEPGRTAQAVSLVDVLPTILEELGLAVPQGLDGRSVAPLLRGEPVSAVPHYAEEHYIQWRNGRRLAVETPSQEALATAVVAGGYWYIAGQAGEDETYSSRDPLQRHSLQALGPLRALARARRLIRPGPAPPPAVPGLAEQLRALGYAGGPGPH